MKVRTLQLDFPGSRHAPTKYHEQFILSITIMLLLGFATAMPLHRPRVIRHKPGTNWFVRAMNSVPYRINATTFYALRSRRVVH